MLPQTRRLQSLIITHAHHLKALYPQPLLLLLIKRMLRVTRIQLSGFLRHGHRHLQVLQIHPRLTLKLLTYSRPDCSSGTLCCAFDVLVHFLVLLSLFHYSWVHVALQGRLDAARHETEAVEPFRAIAAFELARHVYVCGFPGRTVV